jgi:predicted nucleotidyltransferase
MNPPDILLTTRQRDELLKVFGMFVPAVTRVDIFGSRATGRARPGSDVDLVVDGDIDPATLARMARALDDSYLSIFADVTSYGALGGGAFAEAVRRSARPLFDAGMLASAPPFVPAEGLASWYHA